MWLNAQKVTEGRRKERESVIVNHSTKWLWAKKRQQETKNEIGKNYEKYHSKQMFEKKKKCNKMLVINFHFLLKTANKMKSNCEKESKISKIRKPQK